MDIGIKNKFIYLCVCMSVCRCVSEDVLTCACIQRHEEDIGVLFCHYLSFEAGSLLESRACISQLGWKSTGPSNPPVSTLLEAGVTDMGAGHLVCYVGAGSKFWSL